MESLISSAVAKRAQQFEEWLATHLLEGHTIELVQHADGYATLKGMCKCGARFSATILINVVTDHQEPRMSVQVNGRCHAGADCSR